MHDGGGYGGGGMGRGGGGHRGTANEFLDEEEQLGAVYEHRVVARLLPYLRRHKRNGILALVSMLVFTATNVAYPALIKVAIDRYILPGDISGLLFMTAIFFAGAQSSQMILSIRLKGEHSVHLKK